MTDRERLIELLETIPHPQRLYPDLYVDYLIENGVTIVTHCKDCKHRGYSSSCPMFFVEEIKHGDDIEYVFNNYTIDDGHCNYGE